MENETKEEGISLGDIFKKLLNHKWLIVITTLIITIIGTLGVKTVYNPSVMEYRATVEYSFTGLSNNRYPDGSSFDYRNIISLDNLNETYANGEHKSFYSSLNIDELYYGGGIAIATYETNVEGNEDKKSYILGLKATYFKNANAARFFAKDLLQMTSDKVTSIINDLDYSEYLSQISETSNYETQINKLISQYQLLVDGYDAMITTYGDFYVDGVKLSKYKQSVVTYFDDNSLNTLLFECQNNGYNGLQSNATAQENYLLSLNNEKGSLLREKAYNTSKITSLTNTLNDLKATDSTTGVQDNTYEAYHTQIVLLLTRNVDIDNEIELVEKKITNATLTVPTSFTTRITTYANKLTDYTNVYTTNTKAVYNDFTNINFYNTGVISVRGGIGTMITVVASFVIGFVGACCIALIVEAVNNNKPQVLESETKSEEIS